VRAGRPSSLADERAPRRTSRVSSSSTPSEHLERGSFKDMTAAALDRARAIQTLAALHQITPTDWALPTLVREKRAVVIALSYRLVATGAPIDWPRNH
jgi:hypothetical protein